MTGASSVVPALIDALVQLAREVLPDGWPVYDGYGVSGDDGDFLMIGVDDPFSDTQADSVSAAQSVATMGTNRSRNEEGTVRCVVVISDGAADQKLARDAAYAVTSAIERALRAVDMPIFGIPGLWQVGFGSTSTLYQNQSDRGAEAALVFEVAYKARI